MRRILCLFLLSAVATAVAQSPAPPPTPEQLPELVSSLIAKKSFPEAIQACQQCLDAHPDSLTIALYQLSKAQEAAGQLADATASLRDLAKRSEPTKQILDDLARLAAASVIAGDNELPLQTYDYILSQYSSVMSKYQTAGAAGYATNRSVLDQARAYADVIQAITQLPGQPQSAAYLSRLRLFNAYPDSPALRALCLQLAADSLSAKDWSNGLVFCLRVLDYSGDRCRAFQAQLPDNQAYLDAISQPNTPVVITRVLKMVDQACVELRAATTVPEARLAPLSAEWAEAERLSYDVQWSEDWTDTNVISVLRAAGSPRAPNANWETLIEHARGTPFEPLAHLCYAEWLHYRGIYSKAEQHYRKALDDHKRVPGLRYWASFGLAELNRQTGLLAEAQRGFDQCRGAPDAPLAAEAELRGAECLECLGLTAQATIRYQSLVAAPASPYSIRDNAKYSLSRLEPTRNSAIRAHPAESQVSYLGEDRLSQGDWRFRGHDLYVLCAAQGLQDIIGGTRGDLLFTAATTRQADEMFWWRQPPDSDASMLYDPLDNTQHPHNWDDRGEQLPVEAGPDLVVALPVPSGDYHLALYFINDHNYYEPNRRYMVYVTEAASGALVAAAPVRDFVNGVYATFLVRGPATLKVRIWRNRSLNTLLSGIFVDAVDALPTWDQVTSDAFSADAIRTMSGKAHSHTAAAWNEYRQLYARGEDRITQTDCELRLSDTVRANCPEYQAALALDGIARALRKAGFVGQSTTLTSEALDMLQKQSPRQYAEACFRAAETYGALTDYSLTSNMRGFARSTRPGAVYELYGLSQLRRYSAMANVPRSLVYTETVTALGRKYQESGRLSMARVCLTAMAPAGDIQKLSPADAYAYAQSLTDPDAAAAVLQGLLSRDGPLPVPKSHIYHRLVFLGIQRGNLPDAEAAMQTLAGMEAAPDTKFSAAVQLALAYERKKEVEAARKWAEWVIKEFPTSNVIPMAQGVLRNTDAAQKPAP